MSRTEHAHSGSTPRQAREEMACLLRRFMSGDITNYEYEEQFDRLVSTWNNVDQVMYAIHDAMWHHYSDLREHRITSSGCRLSREMRRRVAKWILFLYSNVEYVPIKWELRHKARFAVQLILLAVMLTCPIIIVLGMVFGVRSVYAHFLPGSVWALAGLALWTLGVTVNPAVAERIALAPDSLDPWPFPTEESLKAAMESPRFLVGNDDKDSSCGAAALK